MQALAFKKLGRAQRLGPEKKKRLEKKDLRSTLIRTSPRRGPGKDVGKNARQGEAPGAKKKDSRPTSVQAKKNWLKA